MMTPEQVQRTMEFILSSQADSAVRMDRVEQNMDRLEENFGRMQKKQERFRDDLILLAKEHKRFTASLLSQKSVK
jgi:hypothetical protein